MIFHHPRMFAAITLSLALSRLVTSVPIDTRSDSSSYPVKSCQAFYDSSFNAFSCAGQSSMPDEYSCCYESDGVLMQTQFWDYDASNNPNSKRSVDDGSITADRRRSKREDANVFTIHGLWDDKCDGSYETYCDSSLEISDKRDDIAHIIVDVFGEKELYDKMTKNWVDQSGELSDSISLWEHEYNKHGTCMNTLNPKCFSGSYRKFENVVNFYKKVVELWETLPTYSFLEQAGITPSTDKQYSLSDVQAALADNHDGKEVYVGCRDGAINQIYYYYHLKGNVLTGTYQSFDSLTKSSCPSDVWYLPK